MNDRQLHKDIRFSIVKTRSLVMLLIAIAITGGVSSADDNRFETCKAKLIQAQNLDLLYDMDWKPPQEPRVVVGPTFFTIPIDAKEGFIETVNCFLMAGESDKYINFDVLDWRTGKSVGRYSFGKLKMK
jgi:hypothetical protein